MLHAVIETPGYLADAKAAGVTQAERLRIVTSFAERPMAGDDIPGTGGARKVRFAGRGKGKSGGYRVIAFYAGPDVPLFLLAMFAKGDRADLSQAERNELRRVLSSIADEYRKGDGSHGRGG